MKNFLLYTAAYILSSGCSTDQKTAHVFREDLADSTYSKLTALANIDTNSTLQNDFLSFLIIPIDAACNSCREQSIDKILAHLEELRTDQFIVVSGANAKVVSLYFSQRKVPPEFYRKVVIDTANTAFLNNLVFSHPTIYYSYNSRIIQKIISKPLNIKNALDSFFHSNYSEEGMTATD